MTKYLLVLSTFLLSACSHSINLRASHFAVPVTSEKQWSGHVAMAGTGTTKVTVVNDINTNPPSRTNVRINSDVDVSDVFLVNNLGFDASLGIFNGVDLFLESSLWGLRWQFLNHGIQGPAWVAAVHGAYGEKNSSKEISSSQSTSNSSAESKVKSSQWGASVGYQFQDITPYLSFIQERHDVSTSVTNNSGAFGPYDDHGVHQYLSLGIARYKPGFTYALEYNMIEINWDRADRASQNTTGFKLGYAW